MYNAFVKTGSYSPSGSDYVEGAANSQQVEMKAPTFYYLLFIDAS
jgi:hypothetical protein